MCSLCLCVCACVCVCVCAGVCSVCMHMWVGVVRARVCSLCLRLCVCVRVCVWCLCAVGLRLICSKIYLLFLPNLPKIFTHSFFIPMVPLIIPFLFFCVSDKYYNAGVTIY